MLPLLLISLLSSSLDSHKDKVRQKTILLRWSTRNAIYLAMQVKRIHNAWTNLPKLLHGSTQLKLNSLHRGLCINPTLIQSYCNFYNVHAMLACKIWTSQVFFSVLAGVLAMIIKSAVFASQYSVWFSRKCTWSINSIGRPQFKDHTVLNIQSIMSYC